MNNGYNFKKWGAGRRPLILLHDFGGSGLCWQWVARQMSAGFTCYAPDIPGFGSSPAVENPNLTRLARASLSVIEQMTGEHDERPAIVAHGFGVALALKMVACWKPDWRQLVFINPSLPIGENYRQAEAERMTDHPNRQVAMDTVNRGTTMPLKADRFSLAVESQLMADTNTWHWWLSEGCQETIEPVSDFGYPLTILSSTRDPRVDLIATRREIARRFPAATIREHPTAGHLLPLEDDSWVAARVRAALSTENHSISLESG